MAIMSQQSAENRDEDNIPHILRLIPHCADDNNPKSTTYI